MNDKTMNDLMTWFKRGNISIPSLEKINSKKECFYFTKSAIYCPKIKQFLKCIGMCTYCINMVGWNKVTGSPICNYRLNHKNEIKDSE